MIDGVFSSSSDSSRLENDVEGLYPGVVMTLLLVSDSGFLFYYCFITDGKLMLNYSYDMIVQNVTSKYAEIDKQNEATKAIKSSTTQLLQNQSSWIHKISLPSSSFTIEKFLSHYVQVTHYSFYSSFLFASSFSVTLSLSIFTGGLTYFDVSFLGGGAIGFSNNSP